MMLFIYNLVFLILLPFMVTRIIIKGLKDKDYLSNFLNRFGIYKESSKDNLIWFHAVSLGEVIGSEKLVRKFIEDKDIVLTVSTPTGLRHAQKIYGNDVIVVYAPWDFFIFVSTFIKKFNPICLILFETEIWPSLIYLASKRKIPIVLSNARLSESSLKKYLLFKPFAKSVLKRISLVLAQSNKHLERFLQIGVLAENIKTVGSVKFDAEIQNNKESNLITLNDKFFLAASTHEGEEEIIIESYIKLLDDFPDLKIIIVPRHPERADKVLEILRNRTLNAVIKSDLDLDFVHNDAIVIDATGKLNSLYNLAEIAFIGGSLFKQYGGHNIIEAAKNKCVIIVGPYMKNFEDILNLFKDNSACVQIRSNSELSNAFKELLNNNELRINMIDNATEVVAKNGGSSEKQFKYVHNLINNEISNSNN